MINSIDDDKKCIIALVGTHGSGKTTIGRALSDGMRCEFIDLDYYIEKMEEMSFREIVDDKGYERVRELEVHYLKEIINSSREVIVSLGGSAFSHKKVRNIIKSNKNIISVWTKLSPKHIALRITNLSHRPFLDGMSNAEKKRKVSSLSMESSLFHSQADIMVECDYKSTNEIVKDIIYNVRRCNENK